jgi:hypothetical protein
MLPPLRRYSLTVVVGVGRGVVVIVTVRQGNWGKGMAEGIR